MDIVIFALIALFIFFRLSKELGKVDEEQRNNLIQAAQKQKEKIQEIQNQIIDNAKKQIVEIIESKVKAEEEIISEIEPEFRSVFVESMSRSKITAEFFINGAKSAFEMVLKAFAQGDYETLKMLLSPKIYEAFANALDSRKSLSQTLSTDLIAIDNAKIISAKIIDNFALVTVKFSSRQINFLSDSSGNILDGSKSEITSLTDIWTFKKDLNSDDPNWQISSTSNS